MCDDFDMTMISNWVPTTETFGARLALVRHRMGWNISEAAAASGISESNWRGWELDGRNPQKLVDVAQAISRASGVDDVWLMRGQPVTSDYKTTVSRPQRANPPRRADKRAPHNRGR